MPGPVRTLGVLRPLGGGDPIELKKDELIVGRRPTSDIRLDFENVSGKHCVLRLVKGVWHVRDLGSTNGTTINGQLIAHETGVMPDDEVGIATHHFMIDYDPIAPTSLMDANQVLEEEMGETRKNRSLLELAGLETEGDGRSRWKRPATAPERIVRKSAADSGFEDAVPDNFGSKPAAKGDGEVAAPLPAEDEFFDMIRGDLDEPQFPGSRGNPGK